MQDRCAMVIIQGIQNKVYSYNAYLLNLYHCCKSENSNSYLQKTKVLSCITFNTNKLIRFRKISFYTILFMFFPQLECLCRKQYVCFITPKQDQLRSSMSCSVIRLSDVKCAILNKTRLYMTP